MLTQLLDRLTNYVRDQWHAATYRAATEGGAAGLEDALRDLTGGAVTVSVRLDVEHRKIDLIEDARGTEAAPDLEGLDRPALMRLARERGVEYPRTATADDLRELLTA